MCKIAAMPTNLNIDDNLLARAQKAGRHKTKKETVTQALIEYIERREQKKITELFGRIAYDPEYSYKNHRKRK
jgi:Arc/MetJ family transcription regulator